jgi:hypothetical protein
MLLFCTFADFYEIANVKVFDIQNCQPDKLYFPYYDYDYAVLCLVVSAETFHLQWVLDI